VRLAEFGLSGELRLRVGRGTVTPDRLPRRMTEAHSRR
jgi:hypothetical protein